MRRGMIIFAILTVTYGCGNGGGIIEASNYQGFWLMYSMTFDEGGGPTTYTRDGDPVALRGDVVFEATSETTGTLDVRQGLLEGGVLAGPVSTNRMTVAIEEGHWVLQNEVSLEVNVFATRLSGKRLTLTFDTSDPRNQSLDAPQQVVVERATPWTTQLVGLWKLGSLTIPGQGEITPEDCLDQGGGNYVKMDMTVEITARLLFGQSMTNNVFSDAACTNLAGATTTVQAGMAEEEGGRLRIWGIESGSDNSGYFQFDLALVGDTVNLTRTSCLPVPDCEGSVPTSVELVRTSR